MRNQRDKGGIRIKIPTVYLIDKFEDSSVTVEATRFNGCKPISWAVRKNGAVLSKYDKYFHYEPIPSNRDEEFFKEYRFKNVNSAIRFYRRMNKDMYREIAAEMKMSILELREKILPIRGMLMSGYMDKLHILNFLKNETPNSNN